MDENNLKQGKSIEYFLDGVIMYETNFVDNQENGEVIVYNKDGSIKYSGEHILGKRHGLWSYADKKVFYIEGKLCEEEDLKAYLIMKRFK